MATVFAPVDQRIVLDNISWDTYERLVTDDAGRRTPRLTYDQGTLEIMSPGKNHERDSFALSFTVLTIAIELGLNVDAVGSMTYRRRRKKRGFEADGTFYLLDLDHTELAGEDDGDTDPPPTLVIEIDYSRSSMSKLELFAALQVPEVWRWDGVRMSFYELAGDRYEEVERSRMLPIVSPAVVAEFVKANQRMTKAAWQRSILDWVRAQ